MGFAAGFQVGQQAVERAEQRKREEELRRGLSAEAGRYNVTEGAYGPGLQENITQLQGLREQDPAQAAAYDQAIGELTRRQSLTAPDYSVASGAKNYDTRQEARQAAAPMRTEGLAGVYRQAGMIDKADELEARAFDQQRGIAREAREVAAEADRVSRRPLELQDLQTRTAAGKLGLTRIQQEIDTGALTLADKQRAATAAKNMDNFNVAFGEANAVAQAEGRTLSPREISDLAKANKLSYKQENELIASQVGRTEAEVKQFRLDVEKLTQGKSHDQLIDLHKNDKRFGDGMHFVSEVDKKTGKHVLARVNEATGQVEERLPFKSKAEATAYLMEEARNPANAAIWLQNYQKGAAGIAAQEASAQKDKALAGLYNQGGAGKGGLKQKVSDFKEVYKRDPTEAEMGVLAGLVAKDPNKPEFSPEKYAATVKDFTAAGFSQTDALIKADQLYGRGPNTASEDAGLQKANAAKVKGTSAAPIEVQPGERYITAPGAAVRAPLDQFLRESRRGLFGGVEYFYTDPVTGRRYTTDEYNKLLTK